MFVKNGATVVAALSLLASVDAKRQELHERGSRCNGDNLLNRFRHQSNSAVSFCQTFMNLVTYSVVTATTDEAHVTTPVTTYTTEYPTPFLVSTSYPASRLSSACSCMTVPAVTAVVTEYVATPSASTSTTTTDDLPAPTDDPEECDDQDEDEPEDETDSSSPTDTATATATDDPAATATDDSATTATVDPATTTTDDPATTTTDDSATTTTDELAATATDDSATTAIDNPTTTATDDSATTATDDPTTTATDDPATTATDDPTTTATDDPATTATDDPTATATDTPAGPTSLGCYVEGTAGRALKHQVLDDDKMTLELCASTCTQYAFHGVEYGRECWCDDTIDATAFASLDASVCDFPCAGDAAQTCGGRSTINIYGSGAVPLPPADPSTESLYDYAGCFAEPDGARALPQLYASTKMTVELCHADCSMAGYRYAGLEYGVECWCGNAIAALAELDAGSCGAVCPGDSGETCGGSNALQLYIAKVE